MALYNFKKQFAPLVESGLKRQTIRKRRKRQTVPGEPLHLYTGLRTKNTRKLIDPPPACLAVESVDIYEGEVFVAGQLLSDEDAEKFVIADGFDDLQSFFDFFEKTYSLPIIDELEVIYW
jgi:hypothetical protein